MSEIEFLSWVRGTGFQIAVIIFIAGVIIRLGEILLLGRKTTAHLRAFGLSQVGLTA